MTDSVLEVFEGLTASEARQLRQAIIPTLQTLRDEIKEKKQVNKMKLTEEQIQKMIEGDNIAREESSAEIQAEIQAKIEQRYNDVNERFGELSKDPLNNRRELDEIMKEIESIEAAQERVAEITRKERAVNFRPEKENLESDIRFIKDEIDRLSKNYTSNISTIEQRRAELDKRIDRLAEINSGKTKVNLKWSE